MRVKATVKSAPNRKIRMSLKIYGADEDTKVYLIKPMETLCSVQYKENKDGSIELVVFEDTRTKYYRVRSRTFDGVISLDSIKELKERSLKAMEVSSFNEFESLFELLECLAGDCE